MIVYVFDTSSFKVCQNYYPEVHSQFWEQFDEAVGKGLITSVREVRRELEVFTNAPDVIRWARDNTPCFPLPTPDETAFMASSIFSKPQFRNMVPPKHRLEGKPQADPFVVSRAGVLKRAVVVTEEKPKPNSAKIPTVCTALKIQCISLRDFFKRESWRF